ncbi:MAG: lipoate--protein ligase family protein [Candidatus Desulforudis sp.]|nr:lipoate--protein ligase family protein [Desulforudis sp.]
MAVDEALMINQGRGDTPPTLRFYAWDPPAVSIGYFQNMQQEIDVDACTAQGISTVRRFTGGRAILHDREVTYSLAARPDNPLVAGTVLESYLKISRCLIAGLAELGITAELSTADVRQHKSTACFDTPSRYELVIDGRKLIGSAQARKHICVLQHGSIPLEIDPGKLFAVIRFADEQERKRYRDRFLARAISLNEAGNQPYSYDEVVQALCRGFARVCGIDLKAGALTPREKETARELLREKYGGGDL